MCLIFHHAMIPLYSIMYVQFPGDSENDIQKACDPSPVTELNYYEKIGFTILKYFV